MTRPQAKQNTLDIQKLLVVGAFSSVLVLFALYVYLVSASVLHVVMRQEVERQMTQVHSEISRLEAGYIKAQHSVSEDIASLHGYVEAQDKIFIDRNAVAAVALSQTGQ